MDPVALRVIQISDIHLFADQDKQLLGVPTRKSFHAVIDLLRNHTQQIDLIILSGDLSQDGSTETYAYIADTLKIFKVPTYWITGNHDNFEVMRKTYPRELIANQKHIVLKNWQLILLNSQKPGFVEGYLDTSQLQFLQECLQIHPDYFTAIFFHHHPVSIGCTWLEPLGLHNAKELWEIVARFPKIKAVFFGHIHQQFEQIVNDIPIFSTPSTCFQFKPKQVQFALEKIPPGYRWIDFHQSGYIKTAVERVSYYVGTFDEKATGY